MPTPDHPGRHVVPVSWVGDRRQLLRAQGGVALGLTTLVLPSAIAAASGETVAPPAANAQTDVAPTEGTYTSVAPSPQPPVTAVTTTTESTSTATISTDRDSFPSWTYAYSEDNGQNWTTLATSQFTLTGISGDSKVVLVRKSDGSTTATSRVDLTRRALTVRPADGTVTFSIAAGDSGVRSARFSVLGGRGGTGGNSSARTGGAPALAGYVRQVLALPAGTVLSLRAGYGGTAGTAATSGIGGAGSAGTNGLSRASASGTYNGGAGSSAVIGSGRGGGGGGGAASVVQIGASEGTPVLVAGGSGGGGGASDGTNGDMGRSYLDSDRASGTNGETGFNRTASGGNNNFAGHGGGGGGHSGGGTQDASSGQNQGVGGRSGRNHVADVGGVTVDATYSERLDTTAVSSTPGEDGFILVSFLEPAITQGV